MKRLFSKVLLMVSALLPMATLVAQVPQSMTYQAVVRDASGQPVASSSVGVRFTLLQGNELGTTVWSQSSTVRTDAAGLFTATLTDLQDVDWAADIYFLRSEIDPSGGSDYSIATVQQIFSVPYALHAAVADSVAGGSVFATEYDPVFTAWDRDYNSLTNLPTNVSTFTNDAGYLTSYTETQSLADVVAIGNLAGNQLKSVNDPTEALDAVNLQTLNATAEALAARLESLIARQNSIIDSLRLQLAKLSPNTRWGIDTRQACDSYTWINGRTYTQSDTVSTYVLTAANGADSVVVLHLTILNGFYQYDTLTAVESINYHGNLYTQSGDYTINDYTAQGCDSIYFLHLTLTNPGSLKGDTITACDSYTWWHGITYTASGSYRDTLSDMSGADSIVALYLTIHRSSQTDTSAIVCDSLAWRGKTYSQTGVYIDSTSLTTNVSGCDSSQVLILLVKSSTASDTTASATGNFNWRGECYSASGDYRDTLPNAAGCDSIITLHLTITPTPTSTTWVDLGLPSGLLWAECNLGASTPEGYGNYYAWGEIVPKCNYDWSTYTYCNGSSTTMTKYCNNASYGNGGFTDALTTLQAMDDAATQALGSGARMPTKSEWQELINNTTLTWTTRNGVNGYLFTATNGNTLFLPAAGRRLGSSLDNAGSYVRYWSSSLYESNPNAAWLFYFNSGYRGMDGYSRYSGFSVRAVRASQN